MNRRSFLRGLLALPFIGPLASRVEAAHPKWAEWVNGGTVKMDLRSATPGTIHKYAPSSSMYAEINGIPVIHNSIRYIRTGAWPESDAGAHTQT